MSINKEDRFSRSRPCPVCEGWDGQHRGDGKRCHGFQADDEYAHCSREEFAGSLKQERGDTYAHRMTGKCNCGAEHGQVEPSSTPRIVAEYSYRDEQGDELFQVVRLDPKSFRQRRRVEHGWEWKLNGVRRVPYRLPEIMKADPTTIVWIVEGEKDVDAVFRAGGVATCNPGGAGKWGYVSDVARAVLRDRHVIVVPDSDEKGVEHGRDILNSLHGYVVSLREFPLPVGHKDISEWFKARHTLEELTDIVSQVTEHQPASEPGPPPIGSRCQDLTKIIVERSAEPWISVSLGQGADSEICRLRMGSIAMLTGAPGSGKSTVALAACLAHLRAGGQVLFVSCELDGDELIARLIGMQCDESWEGVLRGKVQPSEMDRVTDFDRMIVLDSGQAKLANIPRAIEQMRAECSAPILLVLDYLQITPGDDKEIRARVSNVAQALRRQCKELRIVGLGISQPSRAAGKALGTGELLGADSMTAMAESSEIERSAYVTLALGARQPEREDGTGLIELSIGKGRFGGGDRVVMLSVNGRTGRVLVDGPPKSAQEVKDERAAALNEKKLLAVMAAMRDIASRSQEPLSGRQLQQATVCRREVGLEAVKRLVAAGELVEVMKKSRASHWMLWTRDQAELAGIPLVTTCKT